MKKYLGTNKLGLSGIMRNNVVLVKGESEKKTEQFVAKFSQLFWMQVKGNREKSHFELGQYMECSQRKDKVEKLLQCIALRGSTDND